jgi:hypothetical protein
VNAPFLEPFLLPSRVRDGDCTPGSGLRRPAWSTLRDTSPADVAQLAERLTCNQQVAGSTPAVGSVRPVSAPRTAGFRAGRGNAQRGADRRARSEQRRSRTPRTAEEREASTRRDAPRCAFPQGEVPEWPKGADCKSAGVCLRRFESSPLHSSLEVPGGNSSVGRAPAFQAGGRGFESRFPLSRPRSRRDECAPIRRAHSDERRRRTPGTSRSEERARGEAGCDRCAATAQVAQSAEHVLGKDEVGGSIPLLGSL